MVKDEMVSYCDCKSKQDLVWKLGLPSRSWLSLEDESPSSKSDAWPSVQPHASRNIHFTAKLKFISKDF